jgi:ribosomal protein S12 methylthiotransferase accessory factor
MRHRPNFVIPRHWLPFVGTRVGLAKRLSTFPVDPDDFDLHHVFPTPTSLARLLGRDGELEPRAGGAGFSLEEAANRAMGELLERYASLAYDGAGCLVSSYNGLMKKGGRAPAFDSLIVFTPEQHATGGFPYAKFTEDTAVGWLEGTELIDGGSTYVPGQLVSLGYRPASGEAARCFYPTSSGCALGTSVSEAVVGALLEVIERDAFMVRWYSRLSPPRLEIEPSEVLGNFLGSQSDGLKICLLDLTLDGPAPVVAVSCTEMSGRPCYFLVSAAAGLDLVSAARKALIEAGQGRPFVKILANRSEALGEGDEFSDFDSNCRFFAEPSNARYVDWFSGNTTVSRVDFPAVPEKATTEDLLEMLLTRCGKTGIRPIAFDLTTVELRDHDLFACKVLVPELVPLCVPSAPFLGHRRLVRYCAPAHGTSGIAGVPPWVPHPFP